jgi:hypothetical protein
MNKIQKKNAKAYELGWKAKWAQIKSGVDTFNPWSKPCEAGYAYMAGESDCPLDWDKTRGGKEVPYFVELWKEKYKSM